MRKGLVIYGSSIPNRYTWALLQGYLDTDPILQKQIQFEPLPYHLYFAPEHEQELRQFPFQSVDFVIFAFSLLAVQIPQFEDFWQKYPQYLKRFHPHTYVIVGGAYPRAKPDMIQHPAVDFLVQDEGEIAFQQLLHMFLENSFEDILQNPPLGILTKTRPQIRQFEEKSLIQVGKAPPFSENHRLFSPFEISRGCPFGCKYCQTGCYGHKMRHAEVSDIIKWAKAGAKIKYTRLWFLSPNSFAFGGPNGVRPNPAAIKELLSGLKEIHEIKEIYFGTFPSEVRPEFVTKEVMDVVVPYVTNKYLVIGAQNASNHLLQYINRGHSFEDVLHAIEICKQYNFSADIDFIFGLPGETEEDIEKNIEFFEAIDRGKIRNVRVHTHTFMPLPGTPFANEPLGVLSPRILKIIGKLAAKRKAFGEHITQAGIGETRYNRRLDI